MTRYRLVLADDHAPIRQCAQDLLEREFEIVGTAADGLEAVDLVTRLRPDAVILDVAMPGLTGLEAAAVVARLVPAPQIVFLTGSEDPADAEEATRLGAGFVLKRRMATRLVSVLREALASSAPS